MPSIAAIQHNLEEFNRFARKHSDGEELKRKWHSLFGAKLSNASAESFTKYYRDMHRHTSKRRRMHGGAVTTLEPAALSYSMGPGVQVYNNFPVGDADPSIIRGLDVYFNSAIGRGCGTEDSSLHVPADMGTRHVGGRMKKRQSKQSKQQKRHTVSYKTKRAASRRRRTLRRQRGGNLAESLMHHPFLSSVPANTIQSMSSAWNGSTTPAQTPSSPVSHTWQYASHGIKGIIDPGVITSVADNFSKLASPPPWQSAT